MGREAIWAFSKLIRFEYSIFSASGVLISGLLAGDLRGFQPEYGVVFLIVFFCAAGSFAFNDYYDFEVDKRNGRHDRPLVSGLLQKRVALITGLICFSLSSLLSLFLNQQAMSLALVSLPLFFLYNRGVKSIILAKNVLISYAFVATILFGSLVSDGIVEPLILYFAAMGFIVGLAFEIMLDIGDVEGDKAYGIETFSIRFGLKKAALVSVVLYFVIMFLDPLPFFVMIDPRLYLDYTFLFLILIPVVSYFFVSKLLMRTQSKKIIFRLKKTVFVTMQVGCIAYLVGVLI